MTNEKKIKILFFAVIFLAVLNIATFLSILWHIKAVKEYNASRPYSNWVEHRQFYPKRPRTNPGFDRLTERLNLDPQQKRFFIEERRNFIKEHRPLMDSLRFYHDLIDKQICSPNPDYKLIDSYARRIGELHYLFVRDNAELFIKYQGQLTDNQRQIFCGYLIKNRHKK